MDTAVFEVTVHFLSPFMNIIKSDFQDWHARGWSQLCCNWVFVPDVVEPWYLRNLWRRQCSTSGLCCVGDLFAYRRSHLHVSPNRLNEAILI